MSRARAKASRSGTKPGKSGRTRVPREAAAAAWAMALGRTLSYGQAHADTARGLLELLSAACAKLIQGAEGEANHIPHDEVMHALGTALVRTRAISGDTQVAQAELHTGVKVLNYASTYWRMHGRWPALDGDQAQTLHHALALYEDILMASSPLQMERAWREHLAEVRATIDETPLPAEEGKA